MGVSLFRSVHDTNSRAPKKDYSLWHKVNVYFVTFQQPQISESFLDEAFQAFGHIADIVVREHTIHSMNLASSGPSSGPSAPSTSEASTVRWVSGYGVVFFTEEAMAVQAVNYMDSRTTATGVNYTCTFRGRVSQPQGAAESAASNEASSHAQQMSLLQRRLMALAENLPVALRDAFLTSFQTSSSPPAQDRCHHGSSAPMMGPPPIHQASPSSTTGRQFHPKSRGMRSNHAPLSNPPSLSSSPGQPLPDAVIHLSLDALPRYISEQALKSAVDAPLPHPVNHESSMKTGYEYGVPSSPSYPPRYYQSPSTVWRSSQSSVPFSSSNSSPSSAERMSSSPNTSLLAHIEQQRQQQMLQYQSPASREDYVHSGPSPVSHGRIYNRNSPSASFASPVASPTLRPAQFNAVGLESHSPDHSATFSRETLFMMNMRRQQAPHANSMAVSSSSLAAQQSARHAAKRTSLLSFQEDFAVPLPGAFPSPRSPHDIAYRAPPLEDLFPLQSLESLSLQQSRF